MCTSVNQNVKAYPNKNLIVTEDGRTYKKPTMTDQAIVGGIGLAASTPIQKKVCEPFQKIGRTFLNDMQKGNDTFKKSVEEAFKQSGLAEKGVEFVDASKIKPEEIAELTKKSIPDWAKKLPKNVQDKLFKGMKAQLKTIKNGGNAAFIPNADKILVNSEKMAGASFHEMGHALNKHKSVIGKTLQKLRGPGMALAPIAALFAAFKRPKADGEKPKNVIDKVTTFIKDNAGKLTFAAFLPTLIEEGMASIKGSKLAAKAGVAPDALKNLNKMHGKAFLTYLGAALAAGVAARGISWINDKINEPRQVV